MKPSDALVSLQLMWGKLGESIEDMPRETALEAMRYEACASLLGRSLEGVSVVLCADMGTSDERMVTTTVGALNGIEGGRLNSLVFQSTPSEVEEKALLRWQ